MIRNGDLAHNLLIPFIKETENLLYQALKSINPNVSCRILPAPDLGFPHDVIRIAGGFPTGCLVEWDCPIPFVPIDTTVNIDTSSVFFLDDDISSIINENTFDWLRSKFYESSYIFNFDKGNHFISFGITTITNRPVLVIHSNEKEFKYQFNGLMPSENNWFSDKVHIFRGSNGRYIRYITGDTANLFVDLAKSLEHYNVIRHRFVAHLLTQSKAKIINQEDYHHYYMPTRQSVAIGCFPVESGMCVPIFSRPGRNITIFKPQAGGLNALGKLPSGNDLLLVPHGWGKTCIDDTSFSIDYEQGLFTLSGQKYEIKTQVSLGKDERLQLRNFCSNNFDGDEFFTQIADHCPGTIVEQIRQVVSFTKNGFERYHVQL